MSTFTAAIAPDERILECVPNFSEGRNPAVIEAIAKAIQSTPGAYLLHRDMGPGAHRTVLTLAGEPGAVVTAAFAAIRTAAQHIDMALHQGEHPRMGATDVCPLVPIQNVSIAEAVQLAHALGERVGRELGIPVYLYEYAAQTPQRRSLAKIRAGEYEGFRQKLQQPAWQPDYGPAQFNPRAGQTVIGVRKILAAYNVNLATQDVGIAQAIARQVRESGYPRRQNGETLRDANGRALRVPGLLKQVRAIGWYMPEFEQAQVSMNLTDLSVTPLYRAYEAVRRLAQAKGAEVTGSELVGLLPKKALIVTGQFYAGQLHPPEEPTKERQLIATAVQHLGLAAVKPFDPDERIIEYRLEAVRSAAQPAEQRA
jgi:glutamate formiminotransferase/formiminotetrahydrofolate cyclodeaminase